MRRCAVTRTARRPAATANQPNTQVTSSLAQNRVRISSTQISNAWTTLPRLQMHSDVENDAVKINYLKGYPSLAAFIASDKDKAPSYTDASTVSPRVTYYTYKANWPN